MLHGEEGRHKFKVVLRSVIILELGLCFVGLYRDTGLPIIISRVLVSCVR